MSSRIPLLRSLAYSLVPSRTVLPPSRSPFPAPRRSHTLSALPFRVVWLSVRSLSPVPAAHSPPRSPGCLSSPALSIFISADAPPGCPCRLHGFFPPGCFSAPDSFPPVCLPAGSSLRKASALPPSLLTCPLRVARIFSRLSAGRLSCCSLRAPRLGCCPRAAWHMCHYSTMISQNAQEAFSIFFRRFQLAVLLISPIIFYGFTFLVKYPTIRSQQQDT